MKTIIACTLLFLLLHVPATMLGQATTTVIWQVNSFDLNVNVQQEQRLISVTATLNATNVGNGTGRTLTVRLNSKASMKSVTVAGAPANFRQTAESRADVQKFEIALPASVAPNASTSITVNYSYPVESNTGLAAISPIGTHFLPLSFWYPMPNTPFTIRGADTAPFKIAVNLPNAVSGGIEKSGGTAGSVSYEQPLHGQPFFIQGDWDKVEGSAESKGIVVLIPRGANAGERKVAETLISFTSAARSFFGSALGPAPDVPVRLISVRRGAGFSDGGTLLFDADALRLTKIDAATALATSETIARMWFGGRVAVRGEGSGVINDGLVRYLATLFLEKQFGREAVQSELYRERLAYSTVAQRDAPLAKANQLDSTYYNSVPNRGAMVWRLIDRTMGHDALLGFLREQATQADGVTLASVRAALNTKGGATLQSLLDQQLDQVIDTDLMVGLPQQRGDSWVSALRNLGSLDVTVPVIATTDRGEVITSQATIPAKNFSEAVFKTTGKIVRVEVDPEKLYPQTSYGNDVVPHTKDLNDALNDAAAQLGAQDFAKAEVTARELLTAAPRLQEARIFLARAMLGANKLDEAEKLFQAALNEPLPFTATLAWANIGLGEINMKRNQPAEAAKRFNEAVIASRDYPSSLAARAARIRAEAAANAAPPIDESARTFLTQFAQAVVTNKRAELESRVVPGELVKFINATIGTDVWETRVVRTEELSGGLLAADVVVHLRKLGVEGNGTAVFLLTRVGGGWKLSGIDLFEVK
ncbi:MAG TPA: hypothetical protein VLB68_15525 [Pyrinomonadaceae bacterium]|nr:hypothetical protein [Pyrinomonadaceae bacterium]